MTVFARSVTYTPPDGWPTEQRGVFDRAHEVVQSAANGADYSTLAPVLSVRLAEWSSAPVQGGTLSIDGETFRVWDVQPDGQGGADLVLKRLASP